jgi:YHS domain-containing protein
MTMTDRRRFLALAAAILSGSGAGAILLSTQASAQVDVNVDSGGLALKGYDPVAYFTRSAPTQGSPAIVATHDGATYRFATQEHRRLFQASPAKYVPIYGGFCAYGVAQGYKVKIEPEAWRVVDGRLYLNYDLSIREKWAMDIPGYVRAADGHWPGLLGQPRAD